MKIITSILFIRNVFVSIANSEAESEDNKSSLLIKILQFAALLLLLFLSAVFTGLNLGLLSLDKTRMQILSDLGTETDKKRIKKIMRVRKHGNALLCTLLLSDLMCNVLISLIMDDLTNPIIAFFVTTFVTVIIGEILPEAICFRYGLAVGAALWWIVFFFMIVLSPIVFPLGEEMGNTYDRKQLKKLIEIHTKEEITQLYGESGINKTDFILLNDAFDFRHKVAEQVMTKMEDVFLLDTTDILNQSLIERIVLNGLSRIPVCEPLAPDYSKYNSNNILGYIDTKDVLLLYINQQLKQEQNIDNDKEINNKKKSDNKNIKTSKSSFQFTFHNKPSKLTIGSIFNQFGHEKVQVTGDTTLPRVLKQMKRNKSHLAIVYINDNSNIEKDPIQQNQGILTREDIAQIFIGEEESRDGEEQDVDEDEEDQKEEVKKRNKIIDELNVIDENGGFGDQKEQSNDNDFKYQFEILDQSKDMEEDNEISGSQIQLNQVINEQTEIELNEQLSISDNKLEQNSNHKNKNKKIYQMEEEGELEHLNTTSDQTEQADILSDQLENDSELLIKSHKTESTNDEKQQHTDHQIKIKVSQSNQSQSSSTQSHSIFLKISKKNLQARRLWQMISPQSDFSDNDSTIIADILMHGLWLFKQRPQSFFGDTSNDLELDVMKLKGLNNEQQMNLKNEQKLSIAGSCGWTIEHMKQLISMSSIFVVPAQDKQQQSKQSTKSGIQLISEDQYPLKSMICQQGTFRPEIILVLEGQVEV
ncbi:MAG: putative cNMP binding protein [Streblomastix strix]|uniref:Putative cNMP binding protein n=1 Tax=Streblomastix strix TaxID=222440 RepID=A0A5J4WKA2_9EUKA|nr:MAG: putative cNMP binding protein [Streblomastix strix]